MEVWKPIPDYEGIYEVSSYGRIRSLSRTIVKPIHGAPTSCKLGGRILKQTQINGYCYVDLCKNSKPHRYAVHRLVAQQFIENPTHLPEVNHKDLDRSNNMYSNLEWVSGTQNQLHKVYSGTKSQAHPVICITTGKVYPSCQRAEAELGYYVGAVSNAANSGRAYKGLTWKKLTSAQYLQYVQNRQSPSL